MAKDILYAYVDGADLENVVDPIETKLDDLVGTRSWISSDVWVVNQREVDASNAVHWDLGLNLSLPKKKPAGWFDDIQAIVDTLVVLQRETGRRFVIGVSNERTGETEDLLFVRDGNPDLVKLRTALDSPVETSRGRRADGGTETERPRSTSAR